MVLELLFWKRVEVNLPKTVVFQSIVEAGSLNTNWTRIFFLAILAINFRIYVPTHEILTHNFHRYSLESYIYSF
jgi:hypothetical protein